jgi:hypothetical protein
VDTARYRIHVVGSVSTIYCKGTIAQAVGAAQLAFTFPAGAQPASIRRVTLAGFQTGDGDDVVIYHATVATNGQVTIYAMLKNAFTWAIQADQQTVSLDSLIFSL